MGRYAPYDYELVRRVILTNLLRAFAKIEQIGECGEERG
jgi:hypothetical protein